MWADPLALGQSPPDRVPALASARGRGSLPGAGGGARIRRENGVPFDDISGINTTTVPQQSHKGTLLVLCEHAAAALRSEPALQLQTRVLTR